MKLVCDCGAIAEFIPRIKDDSNKEVVGAFENNTLGIYYGDEGLKITCSVCGKSFVEIDQ